MRRLLFLLSIAAVAVAHAQSDVQDPVFAFLLSVVDEDRYVAVDGATLDSLATAEGGSHLPVRLIREIAREPVPQARYDLVRLDFIDEVKTPIPYSILKYNPGSIRASKELRLEHHHLGEVRVDLPDDEGRPVPHELRQVELFALRAGHMKMDIDGWLDKLMRGKLDDVELSGFLVFCEGERRVGLGFGYTGGHKGRTGAFDFSANKTIFPASKAYLALGRASRQLSEELADDPNAPLLLRPYRSSKPTP